MSDPRDPVAELCGEDAALLAQTARDLAIEIGKESDDGIAALKEEAARLQSELNQMVGEWPRVVTKLEADVQRAMGREERWKKEARSATERAEKAMEDLRTARLAEEAALEKVRQAEEAARTAAVNGTSSAAPRTVGGSQRATRGGKPADRKSATTCAFSSRWPPESGCPWWAG